MKHLSIAKLAETVVGKRKALKLSQSALADRTGINRSLLSKLEALDYTPSVDQLLALSEVLGFDHNDLFVDDEAEVKTVERKKIAVAGTGYVGLSVATLLAVHNKVYAVDIIPEKVEMINERKSPIQDEYIERYLAEKELDLTATLDAEQAYAAADFVIIAAPTNYDSTKNYFDTSAVESVSRKISYPVSKTACAKFSEQCFGFSGMFTIASAYATSSFSSPVRSGPNITPHLIPCACRA